MNASTDAAGESAPTPDRERPPADPKPLRSLLLMQLHGIPWVGFGAIGSGIGVALLSFYFKSIDFVPPDIPSVLGASVFVAMMAVAFSVLVVASLVAPLWAYREGGMDAYGADDKGVRTAAALTLPALQFLGAGAFLLIIGIRQWWKCEPSLHVWLWSGATLGVPGAVVWLWSEFRMKSFRPSWGRRLASAAWVCVSGTLPLFALWLLLMPSQGADGWHLGALFVAWLLVAVGSAFLVRLPLPVSAVLAILFFPVFAFSIPMLAGAPSLFPTQVAELAGIRSERAMELRVPRSTCLLIESAMGTNSGLNCDEREWITVHAQVLSNLGARWLIHIPLKAANGSYPDGYIRLTVPGEGIHLVYSAPVRMATQCRA